MCRNNIKKQPEISIIVPVYKTERFLSACISSILAQTFTDFELILVDDGSPDSCPALCDAAAAKDSRIRVIHQKNRGLSGGTQCRAGRGRGRMDRLCGFRRHHHAGLLRKALPCGAGGRCTDGRVQLPAGGRSPDPHPGAVSACTAGGADPGAGVGAQHPSALHGGVEQAVPPQHFLRSCALQRAS